MTFGQTLLYSLIGFIVGFFFQLIVQRVKNRQQPTLANSARDIFEELQTGFISYVFLLIILNSYTIQLDITSINKKLEIKNNPHEKAQEYISDQTDNDREFYNLKMKHIDNELVSISEGDIMLTREEMFQFWQLGFQKTNKDESILATNLVSKKDWDYFGPDGDGNRIQNDAVKRGVTIKRVMIISKNEENNKELLSLGKYQQKNNVSVKKIQESRFEEPRIQNDLIKIGNSKDFVVFGDRYLLLTYVDDECKIKRAILSTNIEKIKAAKEIYKWIWDNSKDLDSE